MATDLVLAFAAGSLSFFAPCVVPLLPAYVGYLSGAALPEIRANPAAFQGRVIRGGLLYVAGFGLVFIALGVLAGFAGRGLKGDEVWLQRVGGVVVIAMGLVLAEVLPGNITQRTFNAINLKNAGRAFGPAAPFVLGIVFGTAWSPCVGPVLASILILAANTHRALEGGILLAAYTVGLGLPFVLASLLIASFPELAKKMGRAAAVTSRIAGGLLVILGVLLVAGLYTQLAGYLAAPFNIG